MTKKWLVSIIVAAGLVLGLFAQNISASTNISEAAPAFTAIDTKNVEHVLASYTDKTVILEWTNHKCPYVRKHYETGNMQTLQREATEDGVVWLTVISSAPGKQGHVSAEKADELTASRGAYPTAVLLDEEGALGRLYGAKTTPHMFVIAPGGTLAYAGAIDDNSSSKHATVEGANNYVRLVLADMKSGNAVTTPTAKPYGCSVKY